MIYVIRHGQTDWNKQFKIQGRIDIPLNEVGIQQAKEAGKAIEGKKFDAVFCSPLTRTKQTCFYAYGQDDKIIYDARIQERDFGKQEGLRRDEVDFVAYWTEGTQENADCGETITQMTQRVVSFLDELKANYRDKDVLLVSHGGVIMIMQAYFYGPPKDGNYLNYLVTNASVTTFEFKD